MKLPEAVQVEGPERVCRIEHNSEQVTKLRTRQRVFVHVSWKYVEMFVSGAQHIPYTARRVG